MPNTQPQPDLADLLAKHRDRGELHITFTRLADESGLSTSRLHQLTTGTIKDPPRTATIRALAAALGMTHRQVWDAVGRSIGLDLD